ncbi:hypothetical protein N7448_008591 [Penicillium atrosanguineum]|nr:hypothetical protein N7448_008591 [Penicillium atrosanguineum]
MPLRADEELGKKDDDLHSNQVRFRPAQSRVYPRPRRILIAVIALVALYQFFKHMPTDIAPAAERYNPTIARLRHPPPPHHPLRFSHQSCLRQIFHHTECRK